SITRCNICVYSAPTSSGVLQPATNPSSIFSSHFTVIVCSSRLEPPVYQEAATQFKLQTLMEPRNLPAEVHRVLRVRTAVQVHPWRRKATTSSERPFARHSGCAWY